jgi:hypothetical protein
MSILPNQTNINYLDTWSLLNTSNVQFASSIRIDNGTINTSQIDLDAVRMDCAVINGNPTLLLNGNPVAGVSSLTSSVTTWANYPALNTVTYAPGFGGTINMANVNALTNLSSATAKIGTLTATGGSIGGFTVPLVPSGNNVITSLGSTTSITSAAQQIVIDFAGQPSGVYVLYTDFGTNNFSEFWTASFTIIWGGTFALGGGTHLPSYIGQPPTLSNALVLQRLGNLDSELELLVFSAAPMSLLGGSCTITVVRIT